jgi:hypothetical protein
MNLLGAVQAFFSPLEKKEGEILAACSVGWWLMAGAGLF